ncbi:5'-nucleotidase [Ectothiorhodospiraceae bacterium WFHF3C12]|nr:5'-nucleotidase [Ectothiorhodospiraceae bacterium WFHF3C12]
MPVSFEDKLVVAISSRALFDMTEGHEIFVQRGIDAYCQYQIDNEDVILEPGVAFGLVRKLLALNADQEQPRVEVILLSRNSADTGLRVFNSIEHYGLEVTRAAFTNGASPYRYVPAFGAQLFLSADPNDVVQALDRGYAAATILPGPADAGSTEAGHADRQVRIAFDGDAVLFSDEAERVFKESGLNAFSARERAQAKEPLPGGPFKRFLAALHGLQAEYSAESCPIRTALVTARAAPAHERVIRTLRSWNIRIDEALFLGGLPKADFLEAFGADIFFDDQQGHCDLASRHVTTGHVPHGVANEAGR